jgi:hypothetical protein
LYYSLQEDLSRLTEIEQSMAIFCMATYGEGDPTDNAQQFHDFLQAGNADLTGLRFAVSGVVFMFRFILFWRFLFIFDVVLTVFDFTNVIYMFDVFI